MKQILSAIILVLSLSQLSAVEHRFGWKATPHGIKAAEIKYHPGFKAQPLPKTASVAQWFYPTNQGDRGACVAFSVWEIYSAAHSKDYGQPVKLSALDVYQQCLVKNGNFPNDEGTYLSTGLEVLKNSGSLVEKTWPYSNRLEVLPKLTPYMKGQRTKHRALKGYAVPLNDGGYAIKQCIASLKIGVALGTLWYPNQMNAVLMQCSTRDGRGGTKTVARYVVQNPKGNYVGGHAITYIEYDDDMIFPNGDQGGVRLHNHWEEAPRDPWGDEIGSAWISYRAGFNTRYVDDAVTFEIVKK